jgi:hypothetical protein
MKNFAASNNDAGYAAKWHGQKAGMVLRSFQRWEIQEKKCIAG